MSVNRLCLAAALSFFVCPCIIAFAEEPDSRTWTDTTGQFKVVAEFVELEGTTVTLKRNDGGTIRVPLNRLSQDDQQVARELAEKSRAAVTKPTKSKAPASKPSPQTDPLAPAKETAAANDSHPKDDEPSKEGAAGEFDLTAWQKSIDSFHQQPSPEVFQEVEKWLARIRIDRAALSDSSIPLTMTYTALCQPRLGRDREYEEPTDHEWDLHFKKIAQWREAQPKSVSPLIVEARAWISYAWQARGGGYANTVTEDGWKQFGERMAKGKTLLEEAAKLSDNDPEIYRQLIVVAKSQGEPRERLDELMEKATAIDPWYYPLYVAAAEYLLPRWHGEPSDIEKFAEHWSEKIGGDHGLDIYARVVIGINNYDPDLLRHGDYSLEKLKQSAKVSMERYPDSAISVVFAATVATIADDLEFAQSVREKIDINKIRSEVLSGWGQLDVASFWMWSDPNLVRGQEKQSIRIDPIGVSCFDISADGTTFAAFLKRLFNGRIEFWDVARGQAESVLPISVDVFDIQFDAVGSQVAFCGGERDNGLALIFSLKEEQEPVVIRNSGGQIYSVEFSPDGKKIACIDSKDVLQISDAATGDEMLKIDQTVKAAFSANGSLVFEWIICF